MNATRRLDGQEPTVIAARLSAGVERLYHRLRNVSLPDGMTPERLAVLGTIAGEAPVSVTGLAQLHSVRPTTMSRMVSGLEAEGWVSLEGNKSDRRGKLISLTAKGRVMQEIAVERKLASLTVALTRLQDGDYEALEHLIAKLEEVVDAVSF